MTDRPLIVVYLLGICLGGAVMIYGLVIFIEGRPSGKLMGMTGLLIGLGLIAAAWACLTSLRRAG